jgi:hypothetical protein
MTKKTSELKPWLMFKLELEYSGGWITNGWYSTLEDAVAVALRCFAYEYRITKGGKFVKRGFLDAHRVEVAASQRAAFSPAVKRLFKRGEDKKQASEDSGA